MSFQEQRVCTHDKTKVSIDALVNPHLSQ